MFLLFIAATAAAAVLFLLRIPSVWQSLMALDEPRDMHEFGMALVAARNPFRDQGPPACMAKLIMLRYKLNQVNSRKQRRAPSPARQARACPPPPRQRSAALPWVRMQHRGSMSHN
ncbi:hypothetical protein PENSPDRAFT_689818 [Peniophora sp. CONT]|nr:hypothetical protein PENSPDRAFT_689818 [Peniophora sp. CONT]